MVEVEMINMNLLHKINECSTSPRDKDEEIRGIT
jgi:hypothetical protein